MEGSKGREKSRKEKECEKRQMGEEKVEKRGKSGTK